METFAFHKALAAVWEFINRMNKIIDVTAPWELAKSKASAPQLQAVIYNLLEGLRAISGLIYPIMPDTAATMQKHLGCDPEDDFYKIEKIAAWKSLPPGTKLPKTITLFPRVELKKDKSPSTSPTEAKRLQPELKPEITIEEFSRVDLRVAEVIRAEAIPRAKKLLKLEVDVGEPEPRTVVAGIAGTYAPDDLIGMQVVVVANLKPAKLMGVLSKGMLLAASTDKEMATLGVGKKMPPGTPIR
jgi:methionyl-tRNA synthetase